MSEAYSEKTAIDKICKKIARDGLHSSVFFMKATHTPQEVFDILNMEIEDIIQNA